LTLGAAGWQLPIDRLAAAIGPRTRAIVVNSPSNPTGWTASLEDLEKILALARERNLWIIADEIYARFHFAGGLAPSFQEIRQPEDPILFVNTFSKNWAMTGWRIGWVQIPKTLTPLFESLVQYNTSGVPTFLQRGAIAALEEGEPFVAEQVERARAGRGIVARGLANLNGARHIPPAGAFYAFFALPDAADTMMAAMRLIDEAGVGIAPGAAFGAGSDGCFRICFLRSADQLEDAMRRLTEWARR
jgi:aspartate/methionine/tyrosine aminotransferase